MKIVSINRQHTIDAQNLALNMSEPVSEDLLQRLQARFTRARLCACGSVLMLDLRQRGNEYGFSRDDVKKIGQALHEIENDIAREQDKRQTMLKIWENIVGLPLDESDSPPLKPD